MSIVIDLGKVCLICLKVATSEMRSIFSIDEQQPKITISEKINKCSDFCLQSEKHKLPDKICECCVTDLQAAWRFRQKCESAAAVFRLASVQDTDATSHATLELQPQKIKLPTGLKVRRVPAEGMGAYVISVPEPACHEEKQAAVEPQPAASPSKPVAEVEKDVQKSDEDYSGDAEDFVGFVESDVEIDEMEGEMNVRQKSSTRRSIRATKLSRKSAKKSKEDANEQITRKRTRGRPRKSTAQEGETEVVEYEETILPEVQIKEEEEEEMKEEETPEEGAGKTTLRIRGASKARKNVPKSQPTDVRPHKICDICGNSYRYQHVLNVHMRRHTNDKPFICEVCEKAFVSGVELRRHMHIHTGHKPYSCQYCDRRFSDFGSRIKHERTHTGERPYTCGTCGKAFAYAHVLSVHVRTHTGEKKFQCSFCGRGFTKKVYLQTHMEHHTRSPLPTTNVDSRADIDGIKEEEFIGEPMDIKTVALEECIFTTEYIEEEEDEVEDVEEHVVEEDEVCDGKKVEYELAEMISDDDAEMTVEELDAEAEVEESDDVKFLVKMR